jgi:metal-responsive CopG/Arc/MetJ family transcriptional regulator
MSTPSKKTITTSLSHDELAEFDRIREVHNLTRSQALREAVRRYLASMRHLPAPEEPLPEEVEALREAQEEFARGGGRQLRAVLHDLEHRPKQSR